MSSRVEGVTLHNYASSPRMFCSRSTCARLCRLLADVMGEDSAEDQSADATEGDEGGKAPGSTSLRQLRLVDDEAEDSNEEGEDEEIGEDEYDLEDDFINQEESDEEEAPAGWRLYDILHLA